MKEVGVNYQQESNHNLQFNKKVEGALLKGFQMNKNICCIVVGVRWFFTLEIICSDL